MNNLVQLARRFKGFLAFAALIFLGLIFLFNYLFSQGSFDQLLIGFENLSADQFLSIVYLALGLPFTITVLLIILSFAGTTKGSAVLGLPTAIVTLLVLLGFLNKTLESRSRLPEKPTNSRSSEAPLISPGSSDALTIEDIDQTQIPKRLKALIDEGAQFIDVPVPEYIKSSTPEKSSDYLYCELKMRQTGVAFVFRVSKVMEVGDAADYLVSKILPHLRLEEYQWSIVYEDEVVPMYHTFATAGILSGDTVYLLGNHRRPTWAPAPPLR